MTLCDPCQEQRHNECDGWGEHCDCINPVHRVSAEEGDDIGRLAGRIRGCALLLDYDRDDTKKQLADIAERLDGVNDNLAVVAHLLNNPTSGHWEGGVLRVSLD